MAEFKVVKTGKAMANLADKWFSLRAERLAKEKEAAGIKEQEVKAHAALIQSLVSNDVQSVGGKKVRVSLVRKSKPIASDWSKVYEYIKENDAFDLLQRRLGERAVKDRWDEGDDIPGVEEYIVDDLSYSQN